MRTVKFREKRFLCILMLVEVFETQTYFTISVTRIQTRNTHFETTYSHFEKGKRFIKSKRNESLTCIRRHTCTRGSLCVYETRYIFSAALFRLKHLNSVKVLPQPSTNKYPDALVSVTSFSSLRKALPPVEESL